MQEKSLNPWFSIWIKPRETIQQVIERDPEDLVYLLGALGGISNLLNRASSEGLGDSYDTTAIVVFSIIAGAFAGAVGLFIMTVLIKWTGRLLKGEGNTANIMAALAWSNAPIAWSLLLWPPALALFGADLFTTEMPTVESNTTLLFLFLGYGVIELAIMIWAAVVGLKCLAQVQGFSVWAALGNYTLALLALFGPIFVLALVLMPDS